MKTPQTVWPGNIKRIKRSKPFAKQVARLLLVQVRASHHRPQRQLLAG